MTEVITKIKATKINLHQKSKLLEIVFSDGFEFNFPCEYLRVFSSAAEVKIATQPVYGKLHVNISNIEAQGNYALRLFFDDGHDTGIYAWETLHRLGKEYQKNWSDYNHALTIHNLERGSDTINSGADRNITLLYFMQIANITGTQSETLSVPSDVKTVEQLLQFLSERKESWAEVFTNDKVQVTVNKQFSEPYTPIENQDEIAIIPRPS